MKKSVIHCLIVSSLFVGASSFAVSSPSSGGDGPSNSSSGKADGSRVSCPVTVCEKMFENYPNADRDRIQKLVDSCKSDKIDEYNCRSVKTSDGELVSWYTDRVFGSNEGAIYFYDLDGKPVKTLKIDRDVHYASTFGNSWAEFVPLPNGKFFALEVGYSVWKDEKKIPGKVNRIDVFTSDFKHLLSYMPIDLKENAYSIYPEDVTVQNNSIRIANSEVQALLSTEAVDSNAVATKYRENWIEDAYGPAFLKGFFEAEKKHRSDLDSCASKPTFMGVRKLCLWKVDSDYESALKNLASTAGGRAEYYLSRKFIPTEKDMYEEANGIYALPKENPAYLVGLDGMMMVRWFNSYYAGGVNSEVVRFPVAENPFVQGSLMSTQTK